MASTKYLSIVFTGEDRGATKAFRQVDDAAENTGSKLAQLGSRISPAVAAASAAVVAGVGFAMKAAFDAATESAVIARETERVIQTTGASAWTTADQIGDLATSVSNLTGKDDELIQSSANLLLTFAKVRNEVGEGNDVFDQAVGLSLDLSVALGTDASSASIQLGKALNDPVKGITALSRAGVSFTAEQKEQIKTLVATGDTLSAQKVILGELKNQFGGAAEAAKTPIEALQTKLGNLQESIGTMLMPTIGAIADAVGVAVDAFNALPDPVKNAVLIVTGVGTAALGAIPLVAKIADTFGDVVGPAMDMFRRLVDTTAIGVGELATKLGASQDMGAKLASGLAGSVTPALLAVTAAVTIGFAVWTMYQNAQRENEQRANDFTTALTGSTAAIKDNVAAVVTKQLQDNGAADAMVKYGVNIERVTGALITNGSEIEAVKEAYSIHNMEAGRTTTILQELAAGGSGTAAEFLRLATSTGMAVGDQRNLAVGLDQTSDAYDAGTEKAKIHTAVTDGMANATGLATTNTLAQIESLKTLADELRAQTDPWFAAYKSQQAVTEAQNKLNEATGEYGGDSQQAKDAALGLAEAAISLKGDLIDLRQTNLNGAGAPELEAQLKDLERFGFYPNSEAARALGTEILAVGEKAKTVDGTTVNVPVNSNVAAVNAELEKLRSYTKSVYTSSNYVYVNYGTPGADGNVYTPFRYGGMMGDGPFMVGENGPELGYKIGSSVRIFSNPETNKMLSQGGSMSGGPVNVYVSNTQASPYEIGKEVLWATKVAG
jgi:hypothetical protein